MKINVESYSINGLTQKEFDLIFMAIGLFPTNHPKSSEVFDLLDKFATVAVMSEGGDTYGKDNDRKGMDCDGIQRGEKGFSTATPR